MLNRSYTHKDVLTRASISLQIIDDTALYKAQLYSSNGNIFGVNDKESNVYVKVYKGLEDITDKFTDVVWKRFTADSQDNEEDLKWGEQHAGKTNIIITKEDIRERANIQVELYSIIEGQRTFVAGDFLTFMDVNDLNGSPTPPDSPKDGDLWLDTSVIPPRLMYWDSTLGMWVEVTIAGKDRRNLLRHSNFYRKNFDFWTPVDNPTLEIETMSGKRWARIKSNSGPTNYRGISQKVKAIPKGNYSFQMLSEIYIQSAYPNGDATVAFFSINKAGLKTLIKEEQYDLGTDPETYTSTFESLTDTEEIEVVISGKKLAPFDFVVTNTKLENYPIPTEWELAIEDINDAKVGNSADEVFESLTDGGKMQGIYVDTDENGEKHYYIAGRYISAYNLLVKRKSDSVETLKIDEQGNISMKVNTLQIVGSTGGFENAATENDIAWKVEIISSNGLIFKNNVVDTVLSAKVYKGKDDVTDQIDASRFTWKRTSISREMDTRWNDTQGVGVKQITVTKNDINQRATFSCEISE